MSIRTITPHVPQYSAPPFDVDADYWKNYGKAKPGATAEHKFFNNVPGDPYTIDDSFKGGNLPVTTGNQAKPKGPGMAMQLGGALGNMAAINTANNMMYTDAELPFTQRFTKGANQTVDDVLGFFGGEKTTGTTPTVTATRGPVTPSMGPAAPAKDYIYNPDIDYGSELGIGPTDTGIDFTTSQPSSAYQGAATQGPVNKPVSVGTSSYAQGKSASQHITDNWGGGAVVGLTSFGMNLLQGESPGKAAKNAAYSTAGYAVGSYFGPVGGFVGGALGSTVGNAVEDVLGTVICTELYRRGLMPEDVWRADQAFGSFCPKELIAGYHWWAKPAVRWMQRSNFAVWLAIKIALPWAYHMAYRMGVREKDNWFGYIIATIGEPICIAIGHRRKCYETQ